MMLQWSGLAALCRIVQQLHVSNCNTASSLTQYSLNILCVHEVQARKGLTQDRPRVFRLPTCTAGCCGDLLHVVGKKYCIECLRKRCSLSPSCSIRYSFGTG